jgi:hypothetical protein
VLHRAQRPEYSQRKRSLIKQAQAGATGEGSGIVIS